jgi:Ca-activated chloride channel homolog
MSVAVTFNAPGRLVFLLAPLLLAIAYVVVQRSRQKYALRFTSVDLLASVAPRRPGWQRHIAAVLMLGALLFLVFGFADPERDVKVPRKQATIIVAIDTSTSMAATDVEPDRLQAAQMAARRFVDGLPEGLQVGVVTFNNAARGVVAPTLDHTLAQNGINDLQTGGGTATGDAIMLGLDMVAGVAKTPEGERAPAAIVLLSDGTPTVARNNVDPRQSIANATAAARDAGVRIDTIAFGTPDGVVEVSGEVLHVPADPETMAQIADASGGESFTAESVDQLDHVYDEIRQVVGYETEQRSAAAWFIGFALVAAVLAAIAALFWSQRLI